MQVLCLCGPRESKPRLKCELCKKQYTVTLFDFNHWAHVIVLCVTVQFFLCFILNLRAISEYKPPGACIWRGDLSKGFLRCELGGGGLYLEGLIFRILRYMAVINLPTNAALTMLNYCWRRLLHACIHRSLTKSDQKDDICPFKKEKLFTALHNYVTNKGQLTRPSALLTTSPERVLEAILFNGMNV